MPDSGPLFTSQQWELVTRLTRQCNREQLLWLSGYLAGAAAGQKPETAVQAESAGTVTVLFGSQTGNAEKLAQRLKARLENCGVSVRLESMGSYKPAQLKRERILLIVVSTYGEGDPPDNARLFHEFLLSGKAPRLPELKFAVLALGDTGYEHFCKTGRDFDARLEELGAARLLARVDCDLDYEEAAEGWMGAVLSALPQAPRDVEVASPASSEQPSSYSRQHPFPAPLRENLCLSARGSSKEVRHIELSLEGSGIRYEPGDALGVVPGNWPQRVDDLMSVLGLDADARVDVPGGQETSLRDALLHHYEVTTLTRPFLEKYAALAEARDLLQLLQPKNQAQLKDYLHGREILDVIKAYPVKGVAPAQFVALLRRLPPRLYSIASSFNASPDEVHLTVAVVRYETHGLKRQGVASTFLADRVGEGGPVPVFVENNPNFRLPQDPDTAIIMVGPGTGVAPFRAFMAEREITGARGRNWLFFGDRQFHTDFLYQQEWLEYRQKGLLNRIDVAFSRDEVEKVYVQHRMRESSRDLYAWLEQGAHFYVCGDAQRMAKDVHEALMDVVALASGRGRESAEEYVAALQAGGRYQRDIY